MKRDHDFDSYFMNHALASESWLVDFMSKIRATRPELWSAGHDTQLADEVRHTRLCKGVLEQEGYEVIAKRSASIQVALYERVGKISFADVAEPADFEAALNIIERRARFLYKLYLRQSSNEKFKEVIRTILADELNHIELNQVKPNSNFYERGLAADAYIFGSFLPRKYPQASTEHEQRGLGVFTNMVYWSDLFSDRAHLPV